MKAKTKGRLIGKIINEHFEKEMKYLKETIISLEKRCNDSDDKIKSLEEKLAKKEEVPKNRDEVQNECTMCQQIFESRKSLKIHIKDCHQSQIKCLSVEKLSTEMQILKYTSKNVMKKLSSINVIIVGKTLC